MAENNQESQGLEASTQPGATSKDGDKQSMLLKLAERTVIQAEALAQEITDHAKQESEAAGAKILAQASEKAKAEAQQTVENAKRRSETVINEAAAEVLEESEKTLNSARSESEKMLSQAKTASDRMLSKAKADSEKIMSKARSDGEAGLGNAQNEVQEILGKARQEAQAITRASQTRAESTESNARLKAEFFIRQTTQSVTDGIRASVLEVCNNLLPAVEEFGKDTPQSLNADGAKSAVAAETPMLESSSSDETGENTNAASNSVDSGKPSGMKAKSSAKKRIAA